jgi:hypothetical protein
MLDDTRVNDILLTPSDIRQLESADEIAHFFAKLGYDVDGRLNIPDYAVLGLGSADLRQQIHKIELIGHDPEDGDITIYLLEVRSVTAKLRNDIARRFRDRPENAMLVLTKDYEQLEFVLLERVVSRSQNRGQALKQTIRPIPLTLNRLTPEPVALRVLKRFTFTEEDAAYQWEKLRSAYMLAEWSEEYFNNRALFSDYYLKQRLTDPKITPEWDEDVRPAGRAVYSHLVTARKEYTRKPEQAIRSKLYEPLFQQLGFAFVAQKLGSSSAETPDYLLYAPGSMDKPVAAALTYVWNRNLDDVDEAHELDAEEGGTPSEIPGALVVLFERIFAPFRATLGYGEADCKNNFLKDFMVGKKHLTLGSFGIILKSTEPALRAFIGQHIHDAANRVFGATGAVALLNDEQMVHIRNKAAHDEVLTRTEAQAIRAWAFGILGLV